MTLVIKIWFLKKVGRILPSAHSSSLTAGYQQPNAHSSPLTAGYQQPNAHSSPFTSGFQQPNVSATLKSTAKVHVIPFFQTIPQSNSLMNYDESNFEVLNSNSFWEWYLFFNMLNDRTFLERLFLRRACIYKQEHVLEMPKNCL